MSDVFKWDYDNPLARAKGERRTANSALWDYVQMGAGRSLRKLRDAYEEMRGQAGTEPGPHAREEPPTTRLNTLKGWSSRYQWQDRLSRWEEMERELELDKWRERRENFREEAYQLGRASFDRIRQMLQYPLTERLVLEEHEDGREKFVQVKPAKWSILHVARLMAEANKVTRLALGEPTETTEQRHSGDLAVTGDLAHLEDAELNDRIEQLLARSAAPGPDTLRPPSFRGGPPEKENGHREDQGAQKDGDSDT